MAYTELHHLLGNVRDDIEGSINGKRRRELLREVLMLLATARASEGLSDLAESGACRGLATHLRKLQTHLQESSHLPEALACRYRYKLPEARARRLFRTAGGDWTQFHDLASELDWDPAMQIPRLDLRGLPWHDVLEERFIRQEVVLDADALEGMLIAAMEAYLAPRGSKRKGYEIYGLSLGMIREDLHARPRDDRAMTRYVSVRRSQVQLSADGAFGYVEPNPRSLDAILSVTQEFYPHYRAVGDFHSHPFADFPTLLDRGGWMPSPSDEAVNVDFTEALRNAGHDMYVSFVVAITRSTRRIKRGCFRGQINTLQMSVGDCRAIVAAYRTLGSGAFSAENISLQLSGMLS